MVGVVVCSFGGTLLGDGGVLCVVFVMCCRLLLMVVA